MKLKNMADKASELIVGFLQSMDVFDCMADMSMMLRKLVECIRTGLIGLRS